MRYIWINNRYMKKLLLLFVAIITGISVHAQITITASDMPVSGDTLRYSFVNPVGTTVNLGDSGASVTWDYSTMVPIRQAVDTYKTALSVNLAYALISLTAYGYKVSDSFPIPSSILPVSINQLYTFFQKKTSPSRYSAIAFAAKIASIPTPFNYTTDDDWYFFPLNYLNSDSSNFSLTMGISGTASIKQTGYRKTRVDGWGTITTPYLLTPTACLRVRSEIREIDSVDFGIIPIAIPRNTVEYKWLANGEHYPLMWVTTNLAGSSETITTIRFRDNARTFTTAVAEPTKPTTVAVHPNPAVNGLVTIDVPGDWGNYTISIYDQSSRLVKQVNNQSQLNLGELPRGLYIAQLIHETEVVYAKIEL